MGISNLENEEGDHFYKLWIPLLGTVKTNCDALEGETGSPDGKRTMMINDVRDKLWAHPEWIDDHLAGEGAGLPEEDKEILRSWRDNFVFGRFAVMRHLKKYSVFMPLSGDARLYGVIGITDSVEDTLIMYSVPCVVETALIPFKGRIIYDSLLAVSPVSFGGGFKKSFNEQYNDAKAVTGIIEALGGAASQKKATGECVRITLATLDSIDQEEGAVDDGIDIYEDGQVESEGAEEAFRFKAKEKKGERSGFVRFTKDGRDIDKFQCNCTFGKGAPLCRHVVAGVLSVQGGICESDLELGRAGAAETTVDGTNTARAVGSGDLDVFSTPMMAALMEAAACNALEGVLEAGETSVGAGISIEHKSPSRMGATVSAKATVKSVRGRRVVFEVSASEGSREVGKGTHTRMVVDREQFAGKGKKGGGGPAKKK